MLGRGIFVEYGCLVFLGLVSAKEVQWQRIGLWWVVVGYFFCRLNWLVLVLEGGSRWIKG